MWNFVKEHSYDAVKMFATQCAISIFGLVLVMASVYAKSFALQVGTSIGSVVFYLFLLYTSVWEMGAKDCLSVQHRHMKAQPLKGLYISLIANLLNFLLAIGILLGLLFADVSFFSSLGGICKIVDIVVQSMYAGILTITVGGNALNSYAFVYFLTPLPALLTCWLGYFLGTKNIRLIAPLSAPSKPKNEKK